MEEKSRALSPVPFKGPVIASSLWSSLTLAPEEQIREWDRAGLLFQLLEQQKKTNELLQSIEGIMRRKLCL